MQTSGQIKKKDPFDDADVNSELSSSPERIQNQINKANPINLRSSQQSSIQSQKISVNSQQNLRQSLKQAFVSQSNKYVSLNADYRSQFVTDEINDKMFAAKENMIMEEDEVEDTSNKSLSKTQQTISDISNI